MINKKQHYKFQLLQRRTCLSLFINLIAFIRENHQQLMRRLCSETLNNEQQLCTFKEKLQIKLSWMWMFDSRRVFLNLLQTNTNWKQKTSPLALIRLSQQNKFEVISCRNNRKESGELIKVEACSLLNSGFSVFSRKDAFTA